MVEFRGFECDECSALMAAEQTTKVTVEYDGPLGHGRRIQHLDTKCVERHMAAMKEQGVELTPVRKRGKKEEAEEAQTPPADDPEPTTVTPNEVDA